MHSPTSLSYFLLPLNPRFGFQLTDRVQHYSTSTRDFPEQRVLRSRTRQALRRVLRIGRCRRFSEDYPLASSRPAPDSNLHIATGPRSRAWLETQIPRPTRRLSALVGAQPCTLGYCNGSAMDVTTSALGRRPLLSELGSSGRAGGRRAGL